MGIKRHKPEEIVTKLRQVEVLCGGTDKLTEVLYKSGIFSLFGHCLIG